jgi:hypothetical protein
VSSSAGCRGKSEYFSFGVTRKNAVFWPAAILRCTYQHFTLRKAGEGRHGLEYVDTDKWLIARWFGGALGFFGTETELAVGCVLAPGDGHHSAFVFVWGQREMRHSAAAHLPYLAPHDIL